MRPDRRTDIRAALFLAALLTAAALAFTGVWRDTAPPVPPVSIPACVATDTCHGAAIRRAWLGHP